MGSASQVDTPPVPLTAIYSASTETAVITFDKAIEPGFGDVQAWTFVAAGMARGADQVFNASPIPAQVTIPTRAVAPDGGLPTVTYAGPSQSLKGTNGLLVESFTDFPLTVIA